jgi:hypothetical protein
MWCRVKKSALPVARFRERSKGIDQVAVCSNPLSGNQVSNKLHKTVGDVEY